MVKAEIARTHAEIANECSKAATAILASQQMPPKASEKLLYISRLQVFLNTYADIAAGKLPLNAVTIEID